MKSVAGFFIASRAKNKNFLAFLAAGAFVMSLFLLYPGAARAGVLLSSLAPAAPVEGNPRPSGSGLSAGKFLVASRGIADPIFSKTVILIVGYDKDGAMGFIVNRPSKIPVSKLFPKIKELKKRGDQAYIGGPVEMDRLFLLVAGKKPLPGKSVVVFDGVYISFDANAFKSMAVDMRARFRIYAGYAGWSAGQLESEMARGDWYLFPADQRNIFDEPAERIWPDLIQRAGLEVQSASGKVQVTSKGF